MIGAATQVNGNVTLNPIEWIVIGLTLVMVGYVLPKWQDWYHQKFFKHKASVSRLYDWKYEEALEKDRLAAQSTPCPCGICCDGVSA